MKQLSFFYVLAATFCVQCLDAQTSTLITDRAAARFLDQAAWGPTAASIAQLQQVGIAGWLQAQFALNTSDLPDQPILGSDGKLNRDLTPVQAVFFQNALTRINCVSEWLSHSRKCGWYRQFPPRTLTRFRRTGVCSGTTLSATTATS